MEQTLPYSWYTDPDVLRREQERIFRSAWQYVGHSGELPEPGTFVSARAGKAKDYTYSVVESMGNLHKGVFAGLDESWSGPRGAAKPFIMAAIKTDTDAAYEVAAKKAKDYEKKDSNIAAAARNAVGKVEEREKNSKDK